MRQKVLIATDLSAESEASLLRAIHFAKKQDMWLEVIHVIEDSGFHMPFLSTTRERTENKFHERLGDLEKISEKIAEGLKRHDPNLQVKTFAGSYEKVISEYVEINDISLLFLMESEQTDRPLAKFFAPSKTKKLFSHIRIPAIIMKSREEREYKKILCPTDFSDESCEQMQQLVKLFPEAEFTLFFVIEAASDFRLKFYGLSDEEIDEMREEAQGTAEITAKTFIREGGFGDAKIDFKLLNDREYDAETVYNTAKESGYDLISVYFANEWSFFEDELVKMSDVDVMIYNTQPKEEFVHIVK